MAPNIKTIETFITLYYAKVKADTLKTALMKMSKIQKKT
jgi:hypothetical protein